MVIYSLWKLIESTCEANQGALQEKFSSTKDGILPPSRSYLHHYCIIRKDLPLGVRFAQLIHAAGESSFDNLPSDTHAVALEAESEAELLDLEQKLLDYGIDFCSIREPDAPYFNQLMAIGIKPQVRSKTLRKLTSKFLLVK